MQKLFVGLTAAYGQMLDAEQPRIGTRTASSRCRATTCARTRSRGRAGRHHVRRSSLVALSPFAHFRLP